MCRLAWVLLLTLLALVVPARAAEPTDAELRQKPVTTAPGEVGDLLRQWFREGTAAGNVGDWYDNRDGGHSELDRSPFPQLRKVEYSEDDVKARRHWALQPRTLPHVVFGNSSTSAPPEQSGSNPRTYYCTAAGLGILQSHYRKNNLYVYPEHRDHDPGHNGVGGHGDLYPTNTPYLIISQGSSGSDQPFLRALPLTLAAFRPEVKERLVESGLLMPTVQMILRASNRHLAGPREYLTGKAHPTVFDGAWVDPLKMVRLAHDIRLDSIPPLVKLAVVEEDQPERGRDYFERAGLTERHADTDSVIARVWRGAAQRRRLVVSAEGSTGANGKPLRFTWVVLRGDERRVQIKPRNEAGSVAELTAAYHERRPVAPGSPLESNRVDVGVFAHDGVHYSAPAFVTFFTLDSEARTYDDDGRVVEIGYGMGETELVIADAARLLEALGKVRLFEEAPLAARILGLSVEQRDELGKVARLAAPAAAAVEESRKKWADADAVLARATEARRAAEQGLEQARKDKDDGKGLLQAEERARDGRTEYAKAEAARKERSEELARAEKAYEQLLDEARPVLGAGPRPFVLARLRQAARRPLLWNEHAAALEAAAAEPANATRRGRVEAARGKLQRLGIEADGPGRLFGVRPVRQGAGGAALRLTAFEAAMLEEHNAVVLSELVLPGLVRSTFRVNFVDARLTAPKAWRDVYHYDGDRLDGWTRYHAGPGEGVSEFTAEGWLVTAKDDEGRPARAQPVAYEQDPPARRDWANPHPLRQTKSGESITFEYEGGRRKLKGPAPSPGKE